MKLSLCFQGPRQDSYRYAVTPGDEGDKKKKKKGQKDMEELKQELTMDEHKIPITELYSRLNTDPTTVRTHCTTSSVVSLVLINAYSLSPHMITDW